MPHNVSYKEHKVLDKSQLTDPNVQQRRAADPEQSVWVGASAGTGKTKVLVDRVLRLLLPQAKGQKATEPHRILCLTFTKAAASEMALRINKTLGEWAVINTENISDKQGKKVKGLKTRLRELTGHTPTEEEITAARRLFAKVVDTPGGLKIMTIHSFCQSILGRFPLEAGLSPHFEGIDEGPARELLSKATKTILARAAKEKDTALNTALIVLAAEQNEEQFMESLRGLCSERLQLQSKLDEHNLPDNEEALFADLYEKICLMQGLEKPASPDRIESTILSACDDTAFDSSKIWHIAKALSEGGKTDTNAGITIQLWLESGAEKRALSFTDYKLCFLTKSGTLRAKFPSKAVKESYPDCERYIHEEAQRLLELEERIKIMQCSMMTAHLIVLGKAILNEYARLKNAQSLLDFDDLIDRTLTLLKNEDSASWIMYKLDEGLDHILIDEAQDTNPEQWQIIEALTDDFFSGKSTREELTRTVFTVGDEKQSIYSFQRAAPAEFDRMKGRFEQNIIQAGEKWHAEALNVSFRSTESVLKLVDTVFDDPATRQGLGTLPMKHISFRTGEEGMAELWPLFEPPEKHEEEPWAPPVDVRENTSSQAQMADFIADKIDHWLGTKEELKAKGRPIEPGDIMILVRSRNTLVSRIVRALKKRNIPVSGADRMVLGEQLAVQDLAAIAQFALLPDDDLTLACILKSPFLGWSEDDLYNVAIDRGAKSLWSVVKESGRTETINWLQTLINEAKHAAPYEFFSFILQRPCPADPVSGLRAVRARLGDDVLDPLDEFLNTALSYEQDHIPTLQGFLFWQQSNNVTIKRELEESGNRVRIMTVHGSKGLQAPIVIMPDTTRTSTAKRTPRFLWPDKSGLPLPLWSPKTQYNANSYIEARQNVEAKLDEEYRRLLYVAMTRAEDRLYIGGYKTRVKPIEESWYNHVEKAFEKLDHVEEAPFHEEKQAKRIHNRQTKPVAQKESATAEEKAQAHEEPTWLRTEPAAEPVPPRPLTPSRPSGPEPSMHSPLEKEDSYRFRRGNVTHKLLQVLPDLLPKNRQKAAYSFVQQKSHDLPESVQNDIVKETLTILENPEYAPLFAAGSMAEVPITGIARNGSLISGQIDRLLLTDTEVWIVDYKTNRPPPREESGVPEIYRNQLQSYSDIVAKIYKGRKIRCFLLWTDGARMMEIAI